MKILKNIGMAAISMALMLTTLTSCKDSGFLDINYNPNYPSTASAKYLVAAGEASTVSVMGLYASLTGDMWCQYTTQGNSANQYNTLCSYATTTATSVPPVTTLWQNGYANALEDLKLAIADAEEKGEWNWWLMAKVLTAYNFMMLTDSYGDIPFTEALDPAFANPKFDDSKTVVYPGIIALLDEAIAKEAEANASNAKSPVSNYDCFLGGDMSKWVAFAKSLKLKAYLKDYASNASQIASLLSAGGLLEEDCAWKTWEDATNKSNPLYEYNIRQLNTTENIRACQTFFDYMLMNNDPRIVYIYEPTSDAKKTYPTEAEWLTHLSECYEALPYGAEKIPDTQVAPISKTSRFRQRVDDPVYLMNAAECELMIAEAYARAGNAAQAKAYYEKAVEAGFKRWGLDATPFINGVYAFNESDMLTSIGMMYWMTYAGANSYDGWLTINRLGIPALQPDIMVRANNSALERGFTPGYVPGSLVDATASTLNAGQYPKRLLYPTATTFYNSSADAYVQQNGNDQTKKLWWQK